MFLTNIIVWAIYSILGIAPTLFRINPLFRIDLFWYYFSWIEHGPLTLFFLPRTLCWYSLLLIRSILHIEHGRGGKLLDFFGSLYPVSALWKTAHTWQKCFDKSINMINITQRHIHQMSMYRPMQTNFTVFTSSLRCLRARCG